MSGLVHLIEEFFSTRLVRYLVFGVYGLGFGLQFGFQSLGFGIKYLEFRL